MTFIEKAKRFFEPIKADPIIYIEWIFVALLWGLNWVIHIFFLERITYYITNEKDKFLWILGIYLVFILTYEVLNFLLRKWGWVKIEWYTTSFTSEKYLKQFVRVDNNYIESLWTWKLISIIREWVDRWWFLMWQAIEVLVRLFVAVLFTVYVLQKIDFIYTGIFLLIFLISFLVSRYFNNKLFPYRRERQLNRIEISRHMVKVLMSKQEILQNNSIWSYNEDITDLYKRDVKINQDMGIFRTLLVRNSPLLIILILVSIYYIFGWRVLSGEIGINVLVGITGSIIVIQRIVTESIFSYIDFTKEFIKVETLWEIFDNAPEIKWYSTWSIFTPQNKDITIHNISYGYNDTKVFSDFPLTIKRWQKTALVGASGWGKTTLMKLIAGYLHPESGSISIMGNRLDETALKSYYPHIGYLTQDPWVFDATIRENLVSAITGKNTEIQTEDTMKKDSIVSERNKKDTTVSSVTVSVSQDEILEKALRLAQCDFVFEMEKWLDTEIGERWVRLSGWQKQRLAIAKIFLKDPEIILLDEPTSALDSFSEEKITEALDILFEWRTVIIVAHRLQTVKRADDIIVIEAGQVVERWSHRDLVKQWWIYHKMLELQSGF